MRGLEVPAWGTLGRDPELKTGRSGTPYCHLNVAVTTGKTDDGKDRTQWCRVACFKDAAEKAALMLNKDDRVYFEGSMTVDTWTATDGAQRVTADIAAWKVEKVAAIGKHRQRTRSEGKGSNQNWRSTYQAPINDDLPDFG